jgi:hypothetical protein
MIKKWNFILIMLFTIFICNDSSFAQDKSWLGEYEFVESGMNASGTRSYSNFYKLRIMEEDGFMTGLYESGENSDVYEYLSLTVKTTGNTAYFYYYVCLKTDRDGDKPCVNPAKRGTLMFKLVKSFNKKKKPIILTYGVKNDSLPKGEIFFKKVG